MSGAGSQSARALRIGSFALGGLLLLCAALVSVFGARLFAHTERAVMQFDGSIYGLQVGAPVVFRGVQLGSVVSIGVVHDPRQGGFSIPVVAELNRAMIRDLQGKTTDKDPALALSALVARGLRAELSTQSILTGQLYVSLDLQPDEAATDNAAPAAAGGAKAGGTGTQVTASNGPTAVAPAAAVVAGDADAVEIPTRPNRLQTLQAQLEGFDLRQVLTDLSGISASLRQLLAGPQLAGTLDSVQQASASLQRLAQSLERQAGPLADSARGALRDGQRAAGGLASAADRGTQAAERVSQAADRIGAAAGEAERLLKPDSPLLRSVQRSADELADTATSLRGATANGGATLQELDRALVDVSRAARALRELAETLERQPDALLRGRARTSP